MILADRSVELAAKADRDIPKRPVIHIHAALPDDSRRIHAECISEMKMIVDRCRKQVVGRGDRMEIPGKMQIQVLHGNDLGISAAGCSALYTEARSE